MFNETNLQLDESVVDLLENFACRDDTHIHGKGDIRITGVTAKTADISVLSAMHDRVRQPRSCAPINSARLV